MYARKLRLQQKWNHFQRLQTRYLVMRSLQPYMIDAVLQALSPAERQVHGPRRHAVAPLTGLRVHLRRSHATVSLHLSVALQLYPLVANYRLYLEVATTAVSPATSASFARSLADQLLYSNRNQLCNQPQPPLSVFSVAALTLRAAALISLPFNVFFATPGPLHQHRTLV